MSKVGMPLVRYFAKNIAVAIGLVLIWRGMWYLLDALDLWLFDGNHLVSTIGGIVGGFMILYLPDKDLKEIEKL